MIFLRVFASSALIFSIVFGCGDATDLFKVPYQVFHVSDLRLKLEIHFIFWYSLKRRVVSRLGKYDSCLNRQESYYFNLSRFARRWRGNRKAWQYSLRVARLALRFLCFDAEVIYP